VQQRSPPQRLVEPARLLALQGGADVTVDVGGDRVRRVAQVLAGPCAIMFGASSVGFGLSLRWLATAAGTGSA
jgi:hypothetical protein